MIATRPVSSVAPYNRLCAAIRAAADLVDSTPGHVAVVLEAIKAADRGDYVVAWSCVDALIVAAELGADRVEVGRWTS